MKKEVINQRLKDLGFSQTRAADILEITPQTVNTYINGKKKFGKAAAQKWAEAFGFNPNWLMYDELPVLKPQLPSGIHFGDINNQSPHHFTTGADARVHELEVENAALKAENAAVKAENNALRSQNDNLIKLLMNKNG